MPPEALRIPELLSIIFSHLDKSTNAACAIVCRSWLDPALNELWRCINDPVILFSLLAPMHIMNVTSDTVPHWFFSHFILPSNWTRFEFYAHRIRNLIHLEPDKFQRIDANAYAEIARTRQKLNLLPKLQHLFWHTKLLIQATLFMHRNLTHLVAHVDEPFLAAEGFSEARAFFVEAAARLPNLVCLDIRASFSVVHVQAALLDLLGSAKRLQKIVLPRYWLSSAVVSSLADSPCLEVLQWEYEGQGEGDPKDVATFKVLGGDGSFPALLDLSLEVNVQDATDLVESSFFPDRLTTMFIQSLQFTPPSVIQQFLTSCSMKCHNITNLYLDMHVNNSEVVPNTPQITLETLEPILSCTNLTHFLVASDDPLCINDNDVYVLASRWPSLVSLQLSYDPVTLSTPSLTLAALLPFAEHCQNIEELGLYLNAAAPPPSPSHIRPFTRLNRLHFGTSPIEEEKAVAVFLSRLCHLAIPSIEITAGVTWDLVRKAAVDVALAREVERRRDVWHSVQIFLPMLLAVRSEEQSRSRHLEKEVEALRAQNQCART